MQSAIIVREVSKYLDWLRTLEALDWPRVARWYQTGIVEVYTRVTTLEEFAPGARAVVLTNMTVAEEWRGKGLLSLLLNRMLLEDCGLCARYVLIGNVTNPRLALMLESMGFLLEPANSVERPNLYAPLAPQSGPAYRARQA